MSYSTKYLIALYLITLHRITLYRKPIAALSTRYTTAIDSSRPYFTLLDV
jgi:hypothetical protein